MILNANGRPFTDGVYNITNDIANTISALQTNVQVHEAITNDVMDALYKTGIGNKIIRLKTGYALNNTLLFDNEEDEDIYNEKIAKKIKTVIKWMLVFGRGIIVLHNNGDNLSRPRSSFDPKKCKMSVFSGDMVSVSDISIDLQSDMYLRPLNYIVRGVQIHHSRVVDFRYVQPVELQLPTYRYGGISEFELIRDQLIADGIISRASTTMLEKSASIFYKVDGFRAAVQNKQDSAIINYFTTLERMRSLYGSGIMDKEDEIEPVTQALQNLKETDEIALRRIAMVTGISLIDLVGETPGGLGETGAGELRATRDMVSALQSDYILEPLNELMFKLGMSQLWFNEAQGQTPEQLVKYESMVIDNAIKLESIGEDGIKYLKNKGIVQNDDTVDIFGEMINGEKDTENNQEPQAAEEPGAENGSNNDGNDSGNGEGLEKSDVK